MNRATALSYGQIDDGGNLYVSEQQAEINRTSAMLVAGELTGASLGGALKVIGNGISKLGEGLGSFWSKLWGAGNAVTTPARLVREGQTSVIGKMSDLNAPGAIGSGEFKVADYLPDMGTPKANWAQNDGVLRSIMNEGKPIRDVSPYPMENAGFLGAERNLLETRGWSYSNGYWNAPK